MTSPFVDRILNISEADLMNIDYQDLLNVYRHWKKSEGIIKEKNKEITNLRHRLKDYEESRVQYRGQLQVMESVRGLAYSYDDQVLTLKTHNVQLELQNQELIELNKQMEQIIHDKVNEESSQYDKLSTVYTEFKLLSEKYSILQQSTSQHDTMLANEKSMKKVFETQIIMLENKITILSDENYLLKSKLDHHESKLAQCDQELAHASNQLYQLSLELSSLKQIQMAKDKDFEEAKRLYPLKRDLNPWEIELLHADIARLLKLIEFFPTSEYFLIQWQDAQKLSYIGDDINNNHNSSQYSIRNSMTSINNRNNTYTTINNTNTNTMYPHNSQADDERFIQNWKEVGFSSAAELSHLKRIHGGNGTSSSIGSGSSGRPLSYSFELEAEDWVPHQAAADGLQFLNDHFPHMPRSVIFNFLKRMNKIWQRVERRKLRRIKESYDKIIHDLKRQLTNIKPYRGVMAERQIRLLKQQVREERRRVSELSGRVRRVEDATDNDLLDYDSAEEEEREQRLPTHHRRLCQQIEHLSTILEKNKMNQTPIGGGSGMSGTGGGNATESNTSVVMDNIATRNLLEASLVSLEILGDNQQQQQQQYSKYRHNDDIEYENTHNDNNNNNNTCTNVKLRQQVIPLIIQNGQNQLQNNYYNTNNTTNSNNNNNNSNNAYSITAATATNEAIHNNRPTHKQQQQEEEEVHNISQSFVVDHLTHFFTTNDNDDDEKYINSNNNNRRDANNQSMIQTQRKEQQQQQQGATTNNNNTTNSHNNATVFNAMKTPTPHYSSSSSSSSNVNNILTASTTNTPAATAIMNNNKNINTKTNIKDHTLFSQFQGSGSHIKRGSALPPRIPTFYHRVPFLQGAIWLSRNISIVIDELYYDIEAIKTACIRNISHLVHTNMLPSLNSSLQFIELHSNTTRSITTPTTNNNSNNNIDNISTITSQLEQVIKSSVNDIIITCHRDLTAILTQFNSCRENIREMIEEAAAVKPGDTEGLQRYIANLPLEQLS